jgi:hypothetical protein
MQQDGPVFWPVPTAAATLVHWCQLLELSVKLKGLLAAGSALCKEAFAPHKQAMSCSNADVSAFPAGLLVGPLNEPAQLIGSASQWGAASSVLHFWEVVSLFSRWQLNPQRETLGCGEFPCLLADARVLCKIEVTGRARVCAIFIYWGHVCPA